MVFRRRVYNASRTGLEWFGPIFIPACPFVENDVFSKLLKNSANLMGFYVGRGMNVGNRFCYFENINVFGVYNY